MPSDSVRHKSGEWPDFVSNAQFSQFVDTFNTFASDNRADMSAIRNALANGQSTMAVLDLQVKQTIQRTDDHSDSIKVLNNNFSNKAAADRAVESANKPIVRIRDTIVKTVVTIIVTGCCALVWELIIHKDPITTRTDTTSTIVVTPAPPVPPH